jgi:hypothetical protein
LALLAALIPAASPPTTTNRRCVMARRWGRAMVYLTGACPVRVNGAHLTLRRRSYIFDGGTVIAKRMFGGMDKNVGGIDRVTRLGVGGLLVFAAAAALGGFLGLSAVIAGVALAVGLILLVTGGVQICPLNEIAGIDTYEE